MSEEEIIEILKGYDAKNKKCLSCAVPNREACVLNESDCIDEAIQGLLDLYNKEKEKNKELEKQYKILEVEKVRYNIQYLESNISQTPDTAMLYHSMKKHLETLKEEKIKLEADLQELLEERN